MHLRLIGMLGSVLAIEACGSGGDTFTVTETTLTIPDSPPQTIDFSGISFPSDTTPPEVLIGSSRTPNAVTCRTNTITLEGTATDQILGTVTGLSWSDAATGLTGIPDSHWVADPDPLQP